MTDTQSTESIDLNADIGEYTGTSGASLDASILELVSSASIACGGHAGDLEVMQRTVDYAASRGVAIGAHPSYPDRENFGRREMEISEEELGDQIVSQIEALADCCARAGVNLRYVKPHGALYNVAARDAEVARVIAEAVRSVDPALVLLGLAESTMIYEAEQAGLSVACEAFADRAYLSNGTLLSRDRAGAVLHDAATVANRAVVIARDHYVQTVDGARLEVKADSLCIHGDNPEALSLVTATRQALEGEGFAIRPFA
ncbi:MAG TPA: 5-oxoprolinase subunit PxpA [Gemmatimonadaceae bacterium]|nr:5-oxoprolinase subunit PxpA [Gemmatimonadaceae bacterium]